jgi:hypothetical protein
MRDEPPLSAPSRPPPLSAARRQDRWAYRLPCSAVTRAPLLLAKVGGDGASRPGSRGIVPRRFDAFVPIPEPRLGRLRNVGSEAGRSRPGLGSGLGPWVGARGAPQQSPILRPGQWRLSLRLGSAPISRSSWIASVPPATAPRCVPAGLISQPARLVFGPDQVKRCCTRFVPNCTPVRRSSTVNSFVAKHRPEINGVLQCFDRVILRGHLPMAGVGYFSTWLYSKRIALNLKQLAEGWWNFKDAAPWFAETLKAHARALAERWGRPYRHLPRAERMEENARELAQRDGISEGLVCVYGAMETCRTFRVRYHEDGPKVRPDRRVCLVIYF